MSTQRDCEVCGGTSAQFRSDLSRDQWRLANQQSADRATRRVSAVDVAVEAGMALAAVRLAWSSVLTDDEQNTLDRAAAICGRLSDMDAHNAFLPAPTASSLSVAGPAPAPARSQCSPEREVDTGAGLAPFGAEADS